MLGQLLFVYFSLCNEAVICSVFFMLFYPSTSPNASFVLISVYHSLTKAADNNTPAVKITSLSVSLEATFVAHFVTVLRHFDMAADRFLLLQQAAQQMYATSLRVSSGLEKVVIG